jgi:GT2 family glycosyltransferase
MISIITSTYKSEQHLPTFLKALNKASQSLEDCDIEHEMLVLQNDPSDTELRLINKASKSNKNIIVIKRARESLYATWNFGVQKSKYDLITFWNVDDIRFTPAIKELLKKIDATIPTIAYFPFIYKRYIKILNIDFLVKRKVINPIEYDREKFSKEMHIGPFFAATKSAFQKNGMFDESFRIAGDFEWATRAVKNNLSFLKINKIAGIFKNNGFSLSGSKDERQLNENKRILELNK